MTVHGLHRMQLDDSEGQSPSNGRAANMWHGRFTPSCPNRASSRMNVAPPSFGHDGHDNGSHKPLLWLELTEGDRNGTKTSTKPGMRRTRT